MDNILLFAQSGVEKPALEMAVRIPLSVMNFLEFAIWGAWFVVLGNYLNALHFSRKDIGRIYATMALGSVVSPIFVGVVSDQYFHAEHVMAVLHLAGAGLLYCLAQIRAPRPFYWTALAYAVVYGPTVSLSNSITFANIPDAGRDSPLIRVFGTIGWIAAGLSLRLLLSRNAPVNNRPFLLAAGLSLALGIYSFFLPVTPPRGTGEIPFQAAIALFKDPSFALFFGVSFFITLGLAFYYSWTALYLEKEGGVKPDDVGPVMTIGQWTEVVFFLLLSWFLVTFELKWILAVGMAAWVLRYAIFAMRPPFALMLVGVAIHGICYDFFFHVGFVYVQITAPPELANSGQAMFAVLTYGLGMWLGTEASGWLNQWVTTETKDPATAEVTRVTDWRTFWLIPCVVVALCLIVFVAFFKEPGQ